MTSFCRFFFGLALALGLALTQTSVRAATTISSQVDGRCVSSIAIGLTLAACSAADAGAAFEFNAGGTITNGGKCLDLVTGSVAVGQLLQMASCTITSSQYWRRVGDFLKPATGDLCIAAQIVQPKNRMTLVLQPCAYNADRKWTVGAGVTADWPAFSVGKPSAVVAGATLGRAQMKSLMDWIQAESSINSTPFCWKKPGYQRDPGHSPNVCSGDKIGAICYDKCPSGYGRLSAADPTCGGGCDAGFTPTAVRTCFRDADVKEAHKSSCPGGWTTAPLTCSGGFPVKTRNRTLTCDSGYTLAFGMCGRAAATRSRPIKEASYRIQTCHAGESSDGTLCYASARTGFTCTAQTCTQQCASGSIECGAGCSKNVGTCVGSVVDMVVSPALMMASLATEGALGAAANGVRFAAKGAKEAADLGQNAAQLAAILKDSIESYMAAAENDLAAISTAQVQAAVAAKYPKGSANYRQIAREYAVLQLITALSDMFQQLDLLAVTSADISGISGTVAAFAKPPCTQHTAMP